MAKDLAITVRVPQQLKRRLAQRAKRERRSLSAQVVYELERAVARELDVPDRLEPALGMYAGARLPGEEDFADVRQMLWQRLEGQDG